MRGSFHVQLPPSEPGEIHAQVGFCLIYRFKVGHKQTNIVYAA